MLVSIQGRKMELTPALKSYALEKVSVLNKYLNFNMRVHVTLSVDKFRQRAEVAVSGKGAHLRGMEESEDMYASIDKVIDKIVSQARKFKEKRKDHHPRMKGAEAIPAGEAGIWHEGPEIIREEPDISTSITTDAAVARLAEESRHFLIYRDARGERISVVYHRSDGNIGLIET